MCWHLSQYQIDFFSKTEDRSVLRKKYQLKQRNTFDEEINQGEMTELIIQNNSIPNALAIYKLLVFRFIFWPQLFFCFVLWSSVLYHYLDVSIAFQMTDNQMYIFKSTNHNQSTSFINFDLHAKNTNEPLYGIISPNDNERIQKCNDTEQLQKDSSIQIKLIRKLF